MPGQYFFGRLNARLDRAIGADQLKPVMRSQLVFEQLQGIAQMTPITTVGSLVISVILLALSYNLPTFGATVVWTAALYAALCVAMLGWHRARRDSVHGLQRGSPDKAIRAAIVHSIVMGAIWGALPVIVLPGGDIVLKVATGVVVAGVLCAAGFAMLILPQAALGFSVPLLIGALIAVLRLKHPAEALALTGLLFAYASVIAIVCVRHARNLVHHLVSESQIREQKDIISLLLKEFEDNSADWLWEFDRTGTLQRVSDRFAAAAGVSRDDLVGRGFVAFLRTAASEGSDPIIDEVDQDIRTHATFSAVELRITVAGAERYWRLTGKPVHDEFGVYAGYLGTAADVTAEKDSERRINFLAHNDSLTGLLNRTKFTEHLKQNVARLERYGSPFVVLYLDLDQFKAVNDSRGHLIGDKLLVQVAKRIRSTLREADIAARLGGDEFAIILNNNCDADETAALAQRLVEVVGKPYEFDDEIILIGVSIGIAIAPINGTRPDQILRNADLALYRAKAEGRGTFRFFESQMDSDVRERRMLELELRQALKDGEFMLYYQPLVSAEDNRPSGFEALVRWNHPIRGVVPPAEFIPIAEQTGLIKHIGDWTIREACLAAARWPEDLVVAVNLSAKHFQMSDIAAVVRDALSGSGLPPRRLELEITESLLIERPEDVVTKLAEIKSLGVTIAMDDFGTGYSSLSYLLKFPFDKIKIDKSFVTASSEDAVARDILRSIASLGKTLKIRITAEGVETQQQVDFLRDISCNQLQGFYFAKPLNEPDLAIYFINQFEQTLGALARPEEELVASRLAS
ncbi:MAG: EAL domain-containing protein [Rhizobiaceae bacterium]|nr:EAL domain-containing protein [Rhizobiaceae bacterium]